MHAYAFCFYLFQFHPLCCTQKNQHLFCIYSVYFCLLIYIQVDPLCCTQMTFPVEIEASETELKDSMLLGHAMQVDV